METERIELSERERDRLKVLLELEQGHLKQIEAARRLRLGYRPPAEFEFAVRAGQVAARSLTTASANQESV